MSAIDYPPLNLPAAPLEIRRTADADSRPEVYDPLRRRWVALTPEEWVRQHFVAMLVNCRGFHASLIANEVGLKLNNTSRRCDTVVFDPRKQPWMIIEYKAPTVEITQKTFDQIARYNMVLRARYLTVSNGLIHFCCRLDYERMDYRFMPDLPTP